MKHHYVHSNSRANTEKQQPCCVSAKVPPAFFSTFSGSGRSESSVSSTLATVASLWAVPRPLIGSSGCALCRFHPVNRSSSASKRTGNRYVVRRAAQASGTCDGRGHLGESVLSRSFCRVLESLTNQSPATPRPNWDDKPLLDGGVKRGGMK